jgi:hypothetical protein
MAAVGRDLMHGAGLHCEHGQGALADAMGAAMGLLLKMLDPDAG